MNITQFRPPLRNSRAVSDAALHEAGISQSPSGRCLFPPRLRRFFSRKSRRAAISREKKDIFIIIIARFKAAPFINDCACQNHIFGKAHSICRMLSAPPKGVNLRHLSKCVPRRCRKEGETARRAQRTGGCTLKFAGFRSRQLGEKSASIYNFCAFQSRAFYK